MLGAHLAIFLRGEAAFQQRHQENNTVNQIPSLSEDRRMAVRAQLAPSPQPSPRQKQ